jgi:hypothetical protein
MSIASTTADGVGTKWISGVCDAALLAWLRAHTSAASSSAAAARVLIATVYRIEA